MPECRTYSVLIGSAPVGRAALLAEARARAIPNVRGALISGDMVKVTVDAKAAGSIAAIASEVRRIFAPRSLPAAVRQGGKAVPAQRASAAVRSAPLQSASSEADEFEKEFRGHKRNAIVSLVCFGAFLGAQVPGTAALCLNRANQERGRAPDVSRAVQERHSRGGEGEKAERRHAH